ISRVNKIPLCGNLSNRHLVRCAAVEARSDFAGCYDGWCIPAKHYTEARLQKRSTRTALSFDHSEVIQFPQRPFARQLLLLRSIGSDSQCARSKSKTSSRDRD